MTGLALAACEKVMQIVYEHNLRPAEKLHAPWLERVHRQMMAALTALDAEIARHPLAADAGDADAGRPQRGHRVALHADQAGGAGRRRHVPGAGRAFGACARRCRRSRRTPADDTVNVSTPGYRAP